MEKINSLKVKIFADGADRAGMLDMYSRSYIQGLTTNPTLMKKAGIKDYKLFCQDILSVITDKPLSFEVFSDDFSEMERQAMEISGWGENVYVKIPITNTSGESSCALIKNLTGRGVKVNVTAIMTLQQVGDVIDVLESDVPSYVSIFAGRIADTGRDPLEIMSKALGLLKKNPKAELIWASPRELLNIIQASEIGCHIITVTGDILGKLPMIGYDLKQYSLDTVSMFHRDAKEAGFKL